ncbi:MAG: threonylcarbamoyl-AMP synthase [Anaerolineales bacterium]|nr:threonylcarbamoyl-AMP synthase [Anaerolineae bacterium]PWB54137.1 MAG: threonylcarbamoyl-AMP synthase [Anaerolineales bacterium]
MITELIKAGHPSALDHAVDVLNHGGLVAFPTDTVYGLAALPFKSEFVERLFSAKGRSNTRAIAILIGDFDDLPKVVDRLDDISSRLAHHFWPGPLTLVVPKHAGLPEELSPDTTIGVRMPDHPVALALLRKIGPLAVTSANISGQDNANTAEEVMKQLNGRVHLILDGGHTAGGVPSTVVNCLTDPLTILREGPLSMTEITNALA